MRFFQRPVCLICLMAQLATAAVLFLHVFPIFHMARISRDDTASVHESFQFTFAPSGLLIVFNHFCISPGM